MILVTRSDVEGRLGRPLTVEEDARFDATAEDVSAYLYVVAPRIPSAPPVPSAVVGVASELVIGKLATLPGSANIAQEALGGYSVQYRGASDGLALSKGMEALLRPWTRSRVGSVAIDPSTAVVAPSGPVEWVT